MKRTDPFLSNAMTALALAALCIVGFRPAHAQQFQDDFESATINPFWTIQTWGGGGTATLSTEQKRSGMQSLKLLNPSGVDSAIHLWHYFSSVTKGKASAWVYDSAPGQATRYVVFQVINSTVPPGQSGYNFTLSIQDWDGAWYFFHDAGNWGRTSVPRTLGWHLWEIAINDAGVRLFIDGTEVYSKAGSYGFDQINLHVSGPGWRPAVAFYYDDFSFTPPASVPAYNICQLYDSEKPVKSGATIPIRLQLCDAGGANLSSPSIVLHATGLVQVSTNTAEVVQDAGNANPDNDFRYDSTLGGSGGYVFNLKTTGLATGTYRLSFTAGGDPAVYSVLFQVR
ncbi:MAG: hypothetical protein AAB225_20740 [Acidobacteriota bacterium]